MGILRIGQEENLERTNLHGCAKTVLMHTKTTSSVTSATRSILILETTLILMAKNGYSAKIVTSGFTLTARFRMDVIA